MKRQRSESGSADGRADKKPKTTKEATQEAEEDDTEAFQKQTGEDDEEKEKTEEHERNEPTTVEGSTKRKRGDDEPRSAQEQKPFSCENCGAIFALEKQLKTHKKNSKKCKKTCPKCRITLSNATEKFHHQKNCTGGFQEESSTPSPQETPSTPGIPPPKKQKLSDYQTSDGRFKCPQCDRTYKGLNKLTEHMKKCEPACTLCRRSFSSPLQAQKENHACLGKLCCRHCGEEELADVNSMNSHEATCERTCPYCYAQFSEVGLLSMHITQHCLRFKVMNSKMNYKSYILLGDDETPLQKEDLNATTPALSAIAAALCLAAIDLPQRFDMDDTSQPYFSWLLHTSEVFRIAGKKTSSRPYYATQDNLLRFQTILLWLKINVPLLKDNKPKSHTFNDCFIDVMRKKWALRKHKSLLTQRQATWSKLDELEEVRAKILLLEHDASFVALRKVDPISKMMFDPASVEEAKSIWTARQIRNHRELMTKDQNLTEELTEEGAVDEFNVQLEVDEISISLFQEAQFQMERLSSLVEEEKANLNKKLQRKGFKKIVLLYHTYYTTGTLTALSCVSPVRPMTVMLRR